MTNGGEKDLPNGPMLHGHVGYSWATLSHTSLLIWVFTTYVCQKYERSRHD